MTLQELLLETYYGFGAWHCCQPDESREFRLDFENDDDLPYAHCSIRVTLPDLESDQFLLTLYPVPWDDDVASLARKLGGKFGEFSPGRILELPMTISSVPDIRRLARALRRIVGSGKEYPNPDWYRVATSTADSLESLASLLAEWNQSGRRMVAVEAAF